MTVQTKKLGKIIWGAIILILAGSTLFLLINNLGLKDKLKTGCPESIQDTIPDLPNPHIRESKTNSEMRFAGENYIKVRMSYRGCACGLEYPQYVVDSVLYSDDGNSEFYYNKEFKLQFSDSNLEEKLALPDCSTRCFFYIIGGNAQSNGYGMHRIQVREGELLLDRACCSN